MINGEAAFTLAEVEDYVNLMGNYMPSIPDFQQVTKKEDVLRGYVADLNGRALKGAYICKLSPIIYWRSLLILFRPDRRKWLLRILLPLEAIHFWAAGHSFNYGSGKAAMGLYPENGKVEDPKLPPVV